jgi:hypothetical protein
VAHVGITEREAAAAGLKYHVGINRYSDVVGGRKMGYVRGDADDGFVKLIVDDEKKLLGVHIVGPHAAILVQPFVYLMNAGFRCRKATRRQAGVRTKFRAPHDVPLARHLRADRQFHGHPSVPERADRMALEKLDQN